MPKSSDAELAAEAVPGTPSPIIPLDGADHFRNLSLVGVEDRAIAVPAPLLAKIQQFDREAAAQMARRDEMVALAMALLGLSDAQGVSVDIQTGAVTLAQEAC